MFGKFASSQRVCASVRRPSETGTAACVIEPLESRQLLASVPAGFVDVPVASGLVRPTAMAFSPDGRLFVTQQGGQLRVIDHGQLQAQPFLTTPVDQDGERGLLGVAFDPNFASNGYVYVYYTTDLPTPHNRVSRFTADPANPDVALPGSEQVLFELDPLSSATNHNGGAIHFGIDGKLYVAVGNNANNANSQSLNTDLGKILRLNPDGSIPQDNPFFAQTTGNNRAIWAYGLRNPFTFAIDPVSGRIFINDVGENTWEEIDPGIAGANYGWPQTEGPTTAPGITAPLFAYRHDDPVQGGSAITGGTFYEAPGGDASAGFPVSFDGKYFYSDLTSGYIREFDPTAGTTSGFATGLSVPVDLKEGPDGALYYLERGGSDNSGAVGRVVNTNAAAPAITQDPTSQVVSLATASPQATFAVAASGTAPLAYQWQLNDQDLPGANSPTLTIPVTAGDNGAAFRCVVTNAFGSSASAEATLTTTSAAPPVVTLKSPRVGSLYKFGQKISYSASAVDPQGGKLKSSAFDWRVDVVRGGVATPFVATRHGVTSGSFKANLADPSADITYRLVLTVVDSLGLSTTVTRDLLPQTTTITLQSTPPGVPLTFDGQAETLTTPLQITSVVGYPHSLLAPATFAADGVTYKLKKLAGSKKNHVTITANAKPRTYVAEYVVA